MVDHELSAIGLKPSSAFKRAVIPGLSLSVLTILVVGLILASPVALRWVGTFKGINWSRLSFIGQTYGAISAVVAGIALAAVAVSLILQWRSLGLSRMEIMRNYHHDLIKFTIDHPVLLPSWGYLPTGASSLEDEQRLGFASMLTGFWRTSYEAKVIGDEELRENIAQMFKGETGRNFWANSRKTYAKSIGSRRAQRFFAIMEEQFKKTESADQSASPPHRIEPNKDKQDVSGKRSPVRDGAVIGISFGAGVLAAHVLRHIISYSSDQSLSDST